MSSDKAISQTSGATGSEQLRPLQRLEARFGIAFAAFAIVMLLMPTMGMYLATRNQMHHDLRQRLEDMVSIAALQVDAQAHATLREPDQEGNPTYQAIQHTLQQIRDSGHDIHFVYTMRSGPNGEITFVVDAETTAGEVAHLGDLYHDASSTLRENFAQLSAPMVEEELYTDRWGTWLTGYAPFYGTDGEREGVLGIDIAADQVVSRQRKLLYQALAFYGLLVPIVALIGWLLGRRLAAPIMELTQGAQRIAKGDLSHRVPVHSGSEIGNLARAFNSMTRQLEHSLDMLQKHADNLETTVQERTANLSEANEHLEIEIAERKRAEREMEERWLYLRAVLNAVPDATITLDANHLVATWNSSAEKLFGYTASEALGQDLDQLLTDTDTRQEASSLSQIVLAQQHVPPRECVRYRRDATPVDVILAAAPVVVDGDYVGAVVVYTDISEQKKAEERLAHYAVELEQANREVRQFAYIVSHDLRAPLVNLKGFSYELRCSLDEIQPILSAAIPHLDDNQRRTLAFALEEDIPEALGFIESSVDRMDAFISAVLQLSRLGRRQLEPERLHTNTMVREILDSLAHQIEHNQIQVEIDDLPDVWADRTSFEQILGNTLGNAVKYTQPGKLNKISIWAEPYDAAEASGDTRQVVFHISDTGRGIDTDDVDKVFAPFRRAGPQDVPGEGMGLAYVQTLVRRHGGRIWFESVLGEGSTFHVTLPIE